MWKEIRAGDRLVLRRTRCGRRSGPRLGPLRSPPPESRTNPRGTTGLTIARRGGCHCRAIRNRIWTAPLCEAVRIAGPRCRGHHSTNRNNRDAISMTGCRHFDGICSLPPGGRGPARPRAAANPIRVLRSGPAPRHPPAIIRFRRGFCGIACLPPASRVPDGCHRGRGGSSTSRAVGPHDRRSKTTPGRARPWSRSPGCAKPLDSASSCPGNRPVPVSSVTPRQRPRLRVDTLPATARQPTRSQLGPGPC